MNLLRQALSELSDDDLNQCTDETEKRITRHLRVRTFILASSGLTALQAALWATGARPGTDVICDALFPFALMAIRNVGARPVIADVASDTLTIDPASVARLVSKRTVATVATAAFGIPVQREALAECLRKQGAALIEDHAQAFGVRINGITCASGAQACCFSFQHGKLLSCGQGGGLASQEPDLSIRARRYLELGWYPRKGSKGETDWRGSWTSRTPNCLSGRIAPLAALLLQERLKLFAAAWQEHTAVIRELQALATAKLPEVVLQAEPAAFEGRQWRVVLLATAGRVASEVIGRLRAAGSKAYRCENPPASLWPRLAMSHFQPVPSTASALRRAILLPVATVAEAARELKSMQELA